MIHFKSKRSYIPYCKEKNKRKKRDHIYPLGTYHVDDYGVRLLFGDYEKEFHVS